MSDLAVTRLTRKIMVMTASSRGSLCAPYFDEPATAATMV